MLPSYLQAFALYLELLKTSNRQKSYDQEEFFIIIAFDQVFAICLFDSSINIVQTWHRDD
jgi:hypothetical protein